MKNVERDNRFFNSVLTCVLCFELEGKLEEEVLLDLMAHIPWDLKNH